MLVLLLNKTGYVSQETRPKFIDSQNFYFDFHYKLLSIKTVHLFDKISLICPLLWPIEDIKILKSYNEILYICLMCICWTLSVEFKISGISFTSEWFLKFWHTCILNIVHMHVFETERDTKFSDINKIHSLRMSISLY